MRYVFLALAVGVGVWYFFLRPVPEPPVVAAPVLLSPEQQFLKVISANPVDAGQLASMCSSYPQLGIQMLRGKQIRISGTVAQVRTSGIEGRRADVVLDGPGPRKIVLVVDLDQYSRPAVNFRYVGKFEAVGTELLYLLDRKGIKIKKVVVTQGASISQFASLKTMGATLVEFNMVNGPAWAQAQTNR